MKETVRCPVFPGNEAENENWRVIASDWMMIEGKKTEYSLDVGDGENWCRNVVKRIGEILPKRGVYKLSKLNEFYNIRREPEENMEEEIEDRKIN